MILTDRPQLRLPSLPALPSINPHISTSIGWIIYSTLALARGASRQAWIVHQGS
jgi:hypothetical protein